MNLKLLLFPALFVLLAACTKKDSNKKTTCASTVHGFTTSSETFDTASINIAHHGIVNLATGAMVTSGTFRNAAAFASQGAFNTGDNCYYVFRKFQSIDMGLPESKYSTLYKIDAAGGYVKLFAADTTVRYTSAVYNKADGRLYCIRNETQICQVATGATSFTVSNFVSPAHPFLPTHYSMANIAVDNSTGAMYFATGDTSTFYIEKLGPGGISTSIAATGTNGRIVEMRFNKNDGKLYALKAHLESSYEFVIIDPASGIVTSMGTLPFVLNADIYSATLDPCSNRYLLATGYNGTTPVFAQFDMSGTLVQLDSFAQFYQGLTVDY